MKNIDNLVEKTNKTCIMWNNVRYDFIKEKMENLLLTNKIEVTSENKESVKERLISLMDLSNHDLGWYFNLKEDMQMIIDCAREKLSSEEIVEKIAAQNMQPLYLLVTESMYDEIATEIIDKKADINRAYQLCRSYELSVRKKLIDYFKDDFDEEIETLPTEDIIDMLYDSYCDDSFWAHASITLKEIVEYYHSLDLDTDSDHHELVGGISYTYFEMYPDLIES